MTNTHILDNEIIDSLIDMFNSKEEGNIKIALTILNNADFREEEIVVFVDELNNKCSGLNFALFINNEKEIRARFCYLFSIDGKVYFVNDNTTLDEEGWVPFDIDLN